MALSLFGLMEATTMAGCIILLIVGIVLVVKGGDWFVDAASWFAEVSGIPTFILGVIVVFAGLAVFGVLSLLRKCHAASA